MYIRDMNQFSYCQLVLSLQFIFNYHPNLIFFKKKSLILVHRWSEFEIMVVVAGITVLWAAAAALVPAMQKGNETARNLHIALNGLNVLLFIWQIPTGFDIVLKVFEFTKWP